MEFEKNKAKQKGVVKMVMAKINERNTRVLYVQLSLEDYLKYFGSVVTILAIYLLIYGGVGINKFALKFERDSA